MRSRRMIKELSLKLGTTIICNKASYRIASEVRSGGMGIVYFATSESGEKVIVKRPKLGSSKDAIILDKIRIEAEILRRLSNFQHDNIIRYIDELDDGQSFFLVIEYLDGKNLEDQYNKKPADEQTTKDYAETILRALEFLHGSHNIIHRDINPKNIMNDSNRRLVLIDFGAAKHGWTQLSANSESGGTLIGTLGYSAPEQFTTGEVTPASDIYGVGATIFYLLTGENPKRHMGHGGALTRLPRDVNPSISGHISYIIKKAMSPDPKDRYQTATDMSRALRGEEPIDIDAPHIIFQGRKYVIEERIEIGREHHCPDSHGKNVNPPDIMVDDDQRYISKHHARIIKDRSGVCWIMDLGSRNCTAVSHDGTESFKILKPGKKERLNDGDIVAIVYNKKRGAYMPLIFKG
jgi:serine/threonine protein kinase